MLTSDTDSLRTAARAPVSEDGSPQHPLRRLFALRSNARRRDTDPPLVDWLRRSVANDVDAETMQVLNNEQLVAPFETALYARLGLPLRLLDVARACQSVEHRDRVQRALNVHPETFHRPLHDCMFEVFDWTRECAWRGCCCLVLVGASLCELVRVLECDSGTLSRVVQVHSLVVCFHASCLRCGARLTRYRSHHSQWRTPMTFRGSPC
jgi:hypothetical protein